VEWLTGEMCWRGESWQMLCERLSTLQPRRLTLKGRHVDYRAALKRHPFRKRVWAFHGRNSERKHLLHKLVKEVRVHSKNAAEVWYAFPRPRVTAGPFVDSPIWLLR